MREPLFKFDLQRVVNRRKGVDVIVDAGNCGKRSCIDPSLLLGSGTARRRGITVHLTRKPCSLGPHITNLEHVVVGKRALHIKAEILRVWRAVVRPSLRVVSGGLVRIEISRRRRKTGWQT